MTCGPGGPWLVDFDYADDEQVRLDVTAIIAHGTRIRRKRLREKVAALALLCGIGSAAVVAGRLAVAPDQARGIADSQGQARSGTSSRQHSPPKYNEDTGIVGHDFGPFEQVPRQVPLVVQTSAELPAQFGPLQALVGDSAPDGGVWYVGTSSKVVLFHLSAKGWVQSWPVVSISQVGSWSRFSVFAGLSVVPDGMAWIGVASTLLRVDTRTGNVESWSIPPTRAVYDRPGSRQPVRSLAVSSSGSVAVVLGNASAVQIFNVGKDTWHQVHMPETTDQPEAAGYSRAGALVVGFRGVTRPRRSGVLLDAGRGPVLTATVANAKAIVPYGKSSALVGVGTPDVVSSEAAVRALPLPDSPVDLSGSVLPLVSLPDERFATAAGTQIMSFPAHAASAQQATQAASLYDTAPQGCRVPDELTAANPAEPSGSESTSCPQGYHMLTTDAIGDFWVVRTAAKRTVDLLARQ